MPALLCKRQTEWLNQLAIHSSSTAQAVLCLCACACACACGTAHVWLERSQPEFQCSSFRTGFHFPAVCRATQRQCHIVYWRCRSWNREQSGNIVHGARQQTEWGVSVWTQPAQKFLYICWCFCTATLAVFEVFVVSYLRPSFDISPHTFHEQHHLIHRTGAPTLMHFGLKKILFDRIENIASLFLLLSLPVLLLALRMVLLLRLLFAAVSSAL